MSIPFRIRQSSLALGKCLHHFNQNIVLGIKDPDTEFAKRGTDFHELARRYLEYLRSSRQESDWEYGEELIDGGSWNAEAEEIFRMWFRGQAFETNHLFALEYRVRLDAALNSVDEADEDAADRILYSGDFDRLDIHGTKATIIDFKTFFAKSEPNTVQAVFYPYLLFAIMPQIEEIDFVLEFVRLGLSSEPRNFTRDDIPRMKRYVDKEVERLIRAYESDTWPAAVNSACSYCSLACPLVQEGLSPEAVGQVQTQQRAEKMGQHLYALKLAASKLQGQLKNWSVEAGPIDCGNDITLGFKPVAKWKYETKTIVRLNKEYGFAETRALEPSTAEIKVIGRDYPEFVQEARKTAKNKGTTAFKFWAVAGDPLDQSEDEE